MWELVEWHDGLEVRFRGRITDRELDEANRASYVSLPKDRPAAVVFDLTDVEELTATGDALHSTAQYDVAMSREYPHLVTVIVAPTPLFYGFARQWQLQADPLSSLVVHARGEAVEWLAERGLQLRDE